MRARSRCLGQVQRVAPSQVSDGLEGAEAGLLEAALEGAPGAVALFEVEEGHEPGLALQLGELTQETVETQALEAAGEEVVGGRVHRAPPMSAS